MSVSRLDEAQTRLHAVPDLRLREFMKFGLTSLHHIQSVDGEIDAVALLDVLRYLYSQEATLRAVLDEDKGQYGWGD